MPLRVRDVQAVPPCCPCKVNKAISSLLLLNSGRTSFGNESVLAFYPIPESKYPLSVLPLSVERTFPSYDGARLACL